MDSPNRQPPVAGMDSWLVAVAIVVVLSFLCYVVALWIGKKKLKINFNIVVPMALEAAGTVAAFKMMVLAFRLQTVVQGNALNAVFDAGSIFVGGFVFLIATVYGICRNIVAAYQGVEI